jgi:ParB family chromosome partitioning protein
MGKLDRMMASGGANIAESMGVGAAVVATATSTAPERWKGVSKSKNAVEIPLDRIDRDPTQPREEFEPEALGRLAESLRNRGLLQPIRVRWDEHANKYLIVAGERRWRAARIAGLETLTAIVAEGPIEAGELLAAQLVENCLREDLKPIEQARAYRRLMDLRNWSGSKLASELSIVQGTVSRALSLLDLPEAVPERVEEVALAPSLAHEVAKLSSPAAQVKVAEKAVREKLSRQAVREEVRTATLAQGTKAARQASRLRREFRLEGDAVVSVSVPIEGGTEAILAALDAARRQVAAELRKRGRGEAA